MLTYLMCSVNAMLPNWNLCPFLWNLLAANLWNQIHLISFCLWSLGRAQPLLGEAEVTLSFNAFLTSHRLLIYSFEIISNHCSTFLSVVRSTLLVFGWNITIGSEMVVPHVLSCPVFEVFSWEKITLCDRKMTIARRRNEGCLIRTASNGLDRMWHARSHCGMYNNGGLFVKFVYVSVHKW